MALSLPPGINSSSVPTLDFGVLEELHDLISTEAFLHKLEVARTARTDIPVEDTLRLSCHQAPAATPAEHAAATHPPASAERPPLQAEQQQQQDQQGPEPEPQAQLLDKLQLQRLQLHAELDDVEHSGLLVPEEDSDTIGSGGDFVVVDRDDAVQAMAYYIALYLARVPEAQKLQPKELQLALTTTFKQLRRSRYRQLYSWGRVLYRFSALSVGALQLYQNPWLVRAVAAAIWASSRMAFGYLA